MSYRDLYPFEGHTLDLGGIKMHYLDEGQGSVVVMLHGNPTWSFYFRELVKELRGSYRVIVPDHVGCGLSDKPDDAAYQYTLDRRVDDVERLLDHLGIDRDISLVLHDWGGMIGMAFADRHPERIKRLVLMNTGAFLLPESKSFPWALKLARTPLGRALVLRLNAFSRTASRVCAKNGLSRDVRAAYEMPYDSPKNRIATLRFVEDIPLSPADPAYQTVSGVQDRLGQFRDVPTLICWGERDFVFDRHFLAEWRRRMPHADVHSFEDAGHYVLEDKSREVVPLVSRFFENHPL